MTWRVTSGRPYLDQGLHPLHAVLHCGAAVPRHGPRHILVVVAQAEFKSNFGANSRAIYHIIG